MKSKSNNGIYAFLDNAGILEYGSPEEIAAARCQYLKAYHAAYRKKQRQKRFECTVSFTVTEKRELADASQSHHLPITKLIQCAALAYIRSENVPIDSETLNDIQASLTMIFSNIQLWEESNNGNQLSEINSALETIEKTLQQILTGSHDY